MANGASGGGGLLSWLERHGKPVEDTIRIQTRWRQIANIMRQAGEEEDATAADAIADAICRDQGECF